MKFEFEVFRKIVLFVLWLAFTPKIIAQQLPYQTQFRQLYAYINPAAVNSDYFLYEYNLSVNCAYRMQWIDQPQTPRTLLLNGEYIHRSPGNFKLVTGAMLFRDRTGPLSLTGVYGKIASLSGKDPYFGAFSIGISAGIVQYRILSSRIIWQHLDDPNRVQENLSVSRPEIGLGAYYFKRIRRGRLRQDNFYLGLSIPQLVAADVIQPNGQGNQQSEVYFRRVPHLFGTMGWYHFFNEQMFLELGLWAKYVSGVTPNIHCTGRIQFGRGLWTGAGFNPNGLVHLEAGFNVPGFMASNGQLKIGYAFDYNITAFDLPLGASHEVHIAYLFDTRGE